MRLHHLLFQQNSVSKIPLTTKFLVAHQQEFQPLRSCDPRNVHSATIALGQALWADVLVKGFSVTAQENDAGAQLLLQEGLEQLEDHVEDVRLVDYVQAFHSDWYAVLEMRADDWVLVKQHSNY